MGHQPTVFPTLEHAQEMLQHWARTPTAGYLGSDYGGRGAVLSAIRQPCSVTSAKALLDALAADVPPLRGYFRGASWSQGAACLVLTTVVGPDLAIEV
jgi:hypothetical protein